MKEHKYLNFIAVGILFIIIISFFVFNSFISDKIEQKNNEDNLLIISYCQYKDINTTNVEYNGFKNQMICFQGNNSVLYIEDLTEFRKFKQLYYNGKIDLNNISQIENLTLDYE